MWWSDWLSTVPAMSRRPVSTSPHAVARRALGLLVLVAALAVPLSTAQARTTTKTVPGTVVFANGQKPSNPGNCSAIVFVQWKDVPNTVSATAFYLFKGKEYSKASPSPFNDTYSWVVKYVVPAGSHWIQVGKGWSAGPVANDCSGTSAKQKGLFGTQARVVLTIDADAAACEAAKAQVTKLEKKIADLTRRIKRAKRLHQTLVVERSLVARSAYNRRLVKAQKQVRKVC